MDKIEWQTIDTAPRDGTPILGWVDGEYSTVAWWSSPKIDSPGGWWSLCIPGSYAEDGEWNPTHWMSLPDAPSHLDKLGGNHGDA